MNHEIRMILIEGIPFTGKSTTSEYLANQLRLNGHAAQWISEGILFHRHFPQTLVMLDQELPFSKEVWRAEWQAFIEHARAAAEVLVVDSALCYVGVAPPLNMDWPAEQIDEELARIAALCAPLQPRVIHLTGDVERLVPDSIVERGDAWREQLIRQGDSTPYQQARGWTGLEGVTRMLGLTQDLTAAAIARAGWPALSLDVMEPAWDARRHAILDFLELKEVAVERPALTRADLEAYVGDYVPEDPAKDERLILVSLEGETLIMGDPRQRYGPLVPLSPTRFHLQATPIDIEFQAEPGSPQRLTLFRSDGSTEGYRRREQ